jgi:DNA-binding beta-propeller fold protein YncE
VTFALILIGSVNGNALGGTQQDNNQYSLVAIWGTDGTGDGEFAEPHGVAVDSSDNVYVVDTKNFRIQKLTSDGKFITQWGTDGTGDGEFQKPHSIAVDSSNYIYITDEDNKNVQKYTGDGEFVTQWGFEAAGDETGEPHGIEIDSSGMYM